MSTIIVPGSVYEQATYLEASAAHVGAEVLHVEAGGAMLPLLRAPDGSWRTVYGLPRPLGADSPETLAALADRLAREHLPLVAILSPLHPGYALGELLEARGLRRTSERLICVAELGVEDPEQGFDKRARRAIRTALARGASARISAPQPSFGPFYREAMQALGAADVYRFRDGYFEALASLPSYEVTVEDDHGVAAAALFLHDGRESYYHLGGRRNSPEPPVGAMSLALAEGIREAWRRGCELAVLGGGRGDAPDDSLLAFKRQLAPCALPRLCLEGVTS